MEKSNKLTIGLALGSGSARGWSHIGVINALADQGITPDIVCGTSIGALVG
ncbi:MAG: patatin, partial [Gammaproteobacteria bacterium]